MNYITHNNYKITSSPSYEPVTLSEMKEHLRITDSTEDDFIITLIQVAREYCEHYENRAYCLQTVTAKYSAFGERIILPVNPVIEIESITYIDNSGITQTLDSSQYEIDNYSCPAFVYPAYGISFPNVRDVPNPITITYTAGYDAEPSLGEDVPARVKHAIKLLVGHLYEHREENSEMILTNIPFGVKNLLCERVFL